MSRLSEIRVGHEYHWDVENQLKTIHKGTKTVIVKAIEDRGEYSSPLARVKSLQTGEEFACDVHWLQLPPEFMRRKFLSLRKWYKRHNPAMVFTRERRPLVPPFKSTFKQYVVIDICTGINKVRAVDSDGIVKTFDLAWTKINVARNATFDRLQDEEMEEYKADTENWQEDEEYEEDLLPAMDL